MIPIVVIVGRSNVGKSTLFNRIIGKREAIENNIFESTRDRIYKEIDWQNNKFTLVDTGGLEGNDVNFNSLVKQQTMIAVKESDIVLMVVDSNTGITNDDIKISKILIKEKKKVLLVVNKIDDFEKNNIYEFYSLCLGNPFPVSAIHGKNIGDLLDLIVLSFNKLNNNFLNSKKNKKKQIKIALIGAPNVGKSSLINKLLNKNRMIVTSFPGTTRDIIEEKIIYYGKEYIFTDTAGIRRKSKVNNFLEKITIIKTIKAIEESNVIFLLIDVTQGVTNQDTKISEIALKKGKSIIIVINKCDLINKKDNKIINNIKNNIRRKLYFLNFSPIIFISALTGDKIMSLYKFANYIYDNSNKKIETSTINKLIKEFIALNPPPKHKGKSLKINYATQINVAPPSFLFFVNNIELMHFSYKRHIENKLREYIDFTGVPIKIYLKNKKEKNSV